MTNSEKFKSIFGVYAEEFWSYPKDKMLDWLQYDVPDTNVGDMISRQDAIDALCKMRCGCVLSSCPLTLDEDGAEDCADVRLLMDLPSAQQWIPVSSGKLPDEGVNVITVVAFREWMEYKLNHIIDKESCEWYWDHVVAWMPIEPWEGGDSDGT